jgi:hypothetical protein
MGKRCGARKLAKLHEHDLHDGVRASHGFHTCLLFEQGVAPH